jgi:BirA family transcriptional regulator, biotin operon repressor / biotin---[acetyl-CoA-carboxylase] ligase
MTQADEIMNKLAGALRARLDALEVFAEIGSTNTYLLQQESPLPGRFRVAIAEHQTAGRGREGKSWLSPQSCGLYLSLAYTFREIPRQLSSLTLATGLAIATHLREIGVGDVAVKWPNDIIVHDGKLGGILTEVKPNLRTVVTGIGLNVRLPAAMRRSASWIENSSDLAGCLANPPARNDLAVAVVRCLADTNARFGRDGFDPFRTAWPAFDWLNGKSVAIEQAPGRIAGMADGIDDDGALLVKVESTHLRVISGSVCVIDDRAHCA